MKTALLLLTALQSADLFPVTAKPESGRYLVVFTTKTCLPCRQWKANELPKLGGQFVAKVDADEETQWGISQVPSFWIVDQATRQPVKKFTGYQSAATLLKELESTSVASTPAKSDGQIFGRTGTSHELRETLISHLLSDGIHAGKHTSAELSAMTDEQLDSLHNREHNQSAGTPATTTWTIQPRVQPQVQTRRRGFLFWRR